MQLDDLRGAEMVATHLSWSTRRCTLTFRAAAGAPCVCVVHDVDRAIMAPASPSGSRDPVVRAEFCAHGDQAYLEIALASGALWVIHGARWELG